MNDIDIKDFVEKVGTFPFFCFMGSLSLGSHGLIHIRVASSAAGAGKERLFIIGVC